MNSITHYGVKGMKWGVRKDKYRKGHRIRKGTKIYRVTPNLEEEVGGPTYVTYLTPDRDLYRGSYSDQLKEQYGLSDSAKIYENTYRLKEDLNVPSRDELTEVIVDTLYRNPKTLKAIAEKDWDFSFPFEEWVDDDENENVVKVLRANRWDESAPAVIQAWKDEGKRYIADSIYYVSSNVNNSGKHNGAFAWRYFGMMPEMKEIVIDELKKRGYNAMVDEASVGGGIFKEGIDPLIIFDGAKSLSKKGTKEVDKKTNDEATKRYKDWSRQVNNWKKRDDPW